MVIRLLDCTAYAPGARRKRVWLDLGQTMSLGQSFCTAEHEIVRDCHLPKLVLRNRLGGRRDLILTQHHAFNLQLFAPLNLVPRALDVNAERIPVRYFLEFIALGTGARTNRRKGA